MAAGGSTKYVTVFEIGAKLLGSFRGAMTQAQARLKGLQQAAMKVGSSIRKVALLFSGLFAGVAAFAGAAIFKQIFEGANEAAIEAEQRTRKMVTSLLQLTQIGKKGRAYSEQQVKILKAHNEELAKTQVYGEAILETGTAGLAVAAVPPKYIKQAIGPLADVLAVSKGVNATQEDMARLSGAFGKAIRTGMSRPLREFGVILTKSEQKLLSETVKAGDYMGAYTMLINKMAFAHGEAARLMKTPEGRIKLLSNAMHGMSMRIGKALLPARAALADAWREILPKVEPILIAVQKAGVNALIKLVAFIRSVLLPAFDTLRSWWASEGGKAFADMIGKLGKAFLGMFGIVSDGKKTLGQLVQEKLLKFLQFLTKMFKWIGDNAKWLVPTITTLVVAFAGLMIALEVAAAIAAIANPVGLIITGIALLVAGIVILYQRWDEVKAMFPKTAAVIEQFIEGFKLSFMAGFDFVIAIWKTLVAIFTGDFTGVGEAWKKVWTDIVAMAQWWSDSIVAIAKFVWDYLVGQWGLLKEQWKVACDYFIDTWKKFTKWITDFKVPAWLQKIVGGAGSLITGAGHLVGEAYRGVTGAGGGGDWSGGVGRYGDVTAAASAADIAATVKSAPVIGALADARKSFAQELLDPETKRLVMASTAAEVGGQGAASQLGYIESVMNRAAATGKTLKDTVLDPGYYPASTKSQLGRNVTGAAAEAYSGLLDQAVAGSNIAKYATGNESGGVRSGGASIMFNPGRGERFVAEKWTTSWIKQMQDAAAQQAPAAETPPMLAAVPGLQHGGIARKPMLAQLAERGAEAVVPLHKAGGLGGTHVNFTPNITIHGDATPENQAMMTKNLRELAREFVANFKAAQHHERRLSYEGGYG